MKKVLIQVVGGVAEIVAKPADVEVEIKDFDNEPNVADFSAEDVQEAIES
jgi:flagellar motor switch protein FliM